MNANDFSVELVECVTAAAGAGSPVRIVGGDTKNFYGRVVQAEPLSTTKHCGIVSYEPTELVLSARGGTPIVTVERALAEHQQMLAFEPPHFGAGATIGGMVATGLSGPRRPYAGAVRDFVLGIKILTGKGQILGFGGKVIKNVAGYDVSRLMTGAMGTLGVVLEASFKVLPQPSIEQVRCFDTDAVRALTLMNRWASRPLPITAMCHEDKLLRVRLSGTENGVNSAARHLGGEQDPDLTWFDDLREQRLPFFAGNWPLWRLSLPSSTPDIDLDGQQLLDWGGAQRWIRTHTNPSVMQSKAREHGGHAVCFRHPQPLNEPLAELSPPLMQIHQRLKRVFDPHRILNPGRMYPTL